MAAGEDEAPRRAVPVDLLLQIRQDLGGALDFIEDGALATEPLEEPSRIFPRTFENVGTLKGKPRFVWKAHPGQRRLARLAGAVDGDHRKFL